MRINNVVFMEKQLWIDPQDMNFVFTGWKYIFVFVNRKVENRK